MYSPKNSDNFHSIADLEVYLKSKIAEVPHISTEEGHCSSDPNGLARSLQLQSKLMKPRYQAIDSVAAHQNKTHESKVSVYYTPNDLVDQPQLQLSPMHINFIQENLNTYADYLKPSESMCKFDFDMHRLEANLENEIDRRRRRVGSYPDDDDDETIEINTENTRMLNSDVDNIASGATEGYIRLNTLPKRNTFKRAASGKDLYYSLENIFDPVTAAGHLFEINLTNKTVDEASETPMTSSASENSSSTSNNLSQSNPTNSESSVDPQHPLQSVLVMDETASDGISELKPSNSMPNINKTEHSTKEYSVNDDTDDAVVVVIVNNEHSQLDQMLPNENACNVTEQESLRV